MQNRPTYLKFGNAALLIALVLNLVFWPSWQPSVHADPPDLTEEDILNAHVAIFTSLFNEAWDPNHWTYNLSERVTGPGKYSGTNQYNQPFTLNLVHWAQVDLNTLGLAQQTLDTAIDQGVTLATAVAVLSTSLARVHLFGIIASKYNPNRRTEWTFMPTYYADPDSPLFQHMWISQDQGTLSIDDGFRNNVPAPQGVPESTNDCIDQAIALYDNTVANCNNVYNTTVAGCNNVYNTAVNGPFGCNATFNAAVNAALNTFTNCKILAAGAGSTALLLCLAATTGWGFFFCGAAALALIARLELACAQTFNASMAAALWARNACMAAASATHLACINTAIATRDACINNAEQILIQQIVACPANP